MSAPTPASSTPLTRFVLVGTSHPGNVGAAARAIKVMGFSQLVLVQPRSADICQHPEAIALASGALDVLAGAQVVDQLAQALEGVHVALATAMTPRDFGPPTLAPREGLAALAGQARELNQGVAFVMGNERHGLANEDVYRCHAVLSIPTAAGYGSLNLAQSIQVLAYEWRQALGGFALAISPAMTREPELASMAQTQGLLSHWEQALIHLGYLDPLAPKKLLPRLTQLFNRAQLRQEEVHILRGIAKAMLEASPKPRERQDRDHA